VVDKQAVRVAHEHIPVMLAEAIEALALRPGGCYLDGTYGRGGHSRMILQHLKKGARLLAMDQDPQAVASARAQFGADPRFSIEHGNFSSMEEVARQHQVHGEVDGVLLDLGVSSCQLDDASRGFSFQHDGPLDMRMNPEGGPSAAEWLNHAGEKEIADVLWHFGEERASRRIARAIVADRSETPFHSTLQLAGLVRRVARSREKGKHPATRTFQAIRIHINGELDALRAGLVAAVNVLRSGGRLVVLSFHSLEDRLVKRFMRQQSRTQRPIAGMPDLVEEFTPQLRLCGKARRATATELSHNPRARSVIMRVAERC